ncbi:MAG: hypothetical protein KIS92_03130 [Planctomycetota bacterium]|nr:hypothetical protein [Planctomycetota bacterium]
MSKFGVIARNLYLSNEMRDGLEQYVTDDRKVVPGQLRKRGEWYWLSYLKVIKVKNFDLGMWDLAENEVNTVRMTSFRIMKGKLLCGGSKTEIKEIAGLFDALALQVSGSKAEQTVNYADYYKIDPPTVDLANVLEECEKHGLVADVRKLWIKDMEVKLGSIKSAVINTDDYGGVKKVLAEVGNKATALEIMLKTPEKTYLAFDIDGQVKVISYAAGTDFDFEDLVVQSAMKL